LQPYYFDVLCTVVIGMAGISTVGTGKPFALARPEMQASMAHLGRIGRWHQIQHDTSQGGFVLHKLPQLEKRPTIAASTLIFAPWLLVGALANAPSDLPAQAQTGGAVRSRQGFWR
jgi:hypothetical protein